METKSKVCKKCKEEKLMSEFEIKSNNKDGYEYSCIKCKNEYNKIYLRNYRKNNIEFYNKEKENRKIYYKNNKEIILIKQKEYRKRNLERYKLYMREYRKKQKIADSKNNN